VIASGQAMVKSPGWTQLMADALGREIHVTEFDEATGLGAALLAFERLGMRSAQWDPPDLRAVQPRGAATDRFNDLLQRHKQAYEELVIRN
jgi:sugar (pentulose or hexulose) kinase